jgi:sensor histidine kinase YesM
MCFMEICRDQKQKDFWNFSWGFVALNLLISFGITFAYCPSCYASTQGFLRIWDSFLLSFLISAALSYGSSRFQKFFDQRIPWIHYPVKRLVVGTLAYMSYALFTTYVLIVIFILGVRQSYTVANTPWKMLLLDTKMPMVLAFLITAVFTSRSFLMEWRKSAIEAEQLKTERFAQQYQSLKNQLNPHFLFNSLNVLSNLVYDNPDTASRFINQLSKVYRYVLEVQQEELVSLQKELDFAKNYLSLQKIRFEDGLQYAINIENDQRGFLPPLSLQLLLENAIKHNIASMADPLMIRIEIEAGFLLVKNNLQLKSSMQDESPGIGLSNIRKRYELLSSESMVVEQNNGYFVVRLPLLKMV